jgi:hypothetical protein
MRSKLRNAMNLQEYQKAAIRTESLKENINLNKYFVGLLFKLFVLNADLLDALKKEIYYGNPKKSNETIIPNLSKMESLLREAKYAFNDKDKTVDSEINPRVFHGILGMATEAGELLDVLVKALDGKPIDPVNIQEEMNDSNWYQAINHEALGLNWEEGLERNIAKLKARFPEKFTEENAEHRNLEVERQILEGKKPKKKRASVGNELDALGE